MMTALRWGIITAGKISHDFTNALTIHPATEHQVVAVGARQLESAQAFANQFDIPKAYGSYEEILKDPSVDVVYVGTIHPYHYGLCKLAINAGKHVVCEKPMTMNERQAKEILDLAKNKGVFFTEGCFSRCFPVYEYLREQLKQGAIGDIKFVQASLGFELSQIPRVVEKELGGGALLDLGCYTVQFANMIFNGKPEEIVATGVTSSAGIDVWSTATIHYKNGCAAQVSSSINCEMANTGTIHGTKGVIKIPLFGSPTNIIMPSETKYFPLPTAKYSMIFQYSAGFFYIQNYVRKAILEGKKECSCIPHADSLQIMNIMDEIRRQLGVVYDQDKQ